MSGTLLLAGFLAATTPYAETQPGDFQTKWDGALQVVDQSAACHGTFTFDENDRVRYYPRLNEKRPFSTLTRFRGIEQTELVVVRFGQFNRKSEYASVTIGGGFLFAWDGMSDFTQTPTQVTADTPFVSLLGSLDNYGGIDGCRVTIRANMTRVDPTMDQTAPPRR